VIETSAPAARARRTTRADILAALAEVADPEIPAISIVDLGVVHRVGVPSAPDQPIRVELLPTFVGCPALDYIQAAVEARLTEFGRPLDVAFVRTVPWTSDRITLAGRAALRRAGIAPPLDAAAVSCPLCSSTRVAMDNAFGPTQCRALFWCRACRQPFEAFKPI
jgi:ring-1,2-phenylacetyl-CoA epoxidase subunit PaaD